MFIFNCVLHLPDLSSPRNALLPFSAIPRLSLVLLLSDSTFLFYLFYFFFCIIRSLKYLLFIPRVPYSLLFGSGRCKIRDNIYYVSSRVNLLKCYYSYNEGKDPELYLRGKVLLSKIERRGNIGRAIRRGSSPFQNRCDSISQ